MQDLHEYIEEIRVRYDELNIPCPEFPNAEPQITEWFGIIEGEFNSYQNSYFFGARTSEERFSFLVSVIDQFFELCGYRESKYENYLFVINPITGGVHEGCRI